MFTNHQKKILMALENGKTTISVLMINFDAHLIVNFVMKTKHSYHLLC